MEMISKLLDGGMVTFTAAVIIGTFLATPLPPLGMAVAVAAGALSNASRSSKPRIRRIR